MMQTTSLAIVRRLALAMVTLGLTALVATPALAGAASSSSRSIVGVWRVQVTLRNCDTGAPLGPPFSALVTFHQGGTVSEVAGGVAFAPGQRSPGTGTWTREPERLYGQSMVALILFDSPANLPGTPGFDPTKPVSPGFFAGWQTVTHAVTPTDADHITSVGVNAFYKSNGELYRSGCSTATGERFE
jgi:hypothetical protein